MEDAIKFTHSFFLQLHRLQSSELRDCLRKISWKRWRRGGTTKRGRVSHSRRRREKVKIELEYGKGEDAEFTC